MPEDAARAAAGRPCNTKFRPQAKHADRSAAIRYTAMRSRPARDRMHFRQWKRREFITLIGGAVAWPLAARAQQGERVRRIGMLMALASDDPEAQARNAAFLQTLSELG